MDSMEAGVGLVAVVAYVAARGNPLPLLLSWLVDAFALATAWVDTLPPMLANQIMFGVVGALVFNSKAMVDSLKRAVVTTWHDLRFTAVDVKDTSEIYEWIAAYVASRPDVLSTQARLTLKLERECGSSGPREPFFMAQEKVQEEENNALQLELDDNADEHDVDGE